MNLQTLRNMRARYFMAGMTELVEAFDYMLQYVPRDESVENGAEKEVRKVLEGTGQNVLTVEWLDEDGMFEVEFMHIVYRYELAAEFNVSDVDGMWAWVTPKWEIVK